MKLMTKDTDYAVRALAFIARAGKKIVSVPELVGELKISRSFLRKILQTLNRENVLKSYKGRGGGFELAQPAASITFIDIMKIFQGEPRFSDCILKNSVCCDAATCVLKQRISVVERHLVSELRAISLESLIGRGRRPAKSFENRKWNNRPQ